MFIYREEIDGLRSIAVIPVILYHAGLTRYFSGGYIGVDIFFVISGYLITSVIQNECEEGTFSLIHFYERRCRRILPALFFILFLSCFFAYYLMLPEQLKEFGETLISVLCLSSNIYFWWKDDGYFSRLTELNPLVHTWSLAVEEQFYFIFPLLCYLFMKKKHYLIILLICFAMISFILCQWGGNFEFISTNQFQMFSQYRYATFYLPIGRIWELLIGTFIAFYLRDNDHLNTKKKSKELNELFSSVGLGLIVISIVYLDNQNIPPFPNSYTLVPTIGAGLIIVFGNKDTLVGYLLSTRLLRWIGLISYSAYLWHQPLLAFSRLRSTKISEILMISLVFPLSIFSYFLVEQPFRTKKRFSRKQIFFISGLAFALTFILGLFSIQTANTQFFILNKPGEDTYMSDLIEHGNPKYIGDRYGTLERTYKTFSNETNKKLVLIGDSYSHDFYNMILEGKYLSNYEIRVHYINVECQIYLGNEDRRKYIEKKYHQLCSVRDIKYALPLIKQANVIVLAARWHDWTAERLPMTIKLLNLTKQQQLFVIGTKHFAVGNLNLYVNKSTEFRIKQYRYPDQYFIKVNNILEKTIDKSIFVNVMKMICTGFNQTCPLFTPNGKLISYDGTHLTKYGALHIGSIIFRNKPLNKLL